MKQTILVCTVVLLVLSVLSETGESRPDPREAKCSARAKAGICHRIKRPVCGTDGKTYDNECLLCFHNQKENEHVMIKADGPCHVALTKERKPWKMLRRGRRQERPIAGM